MFDLAALRPFQNLHLIPTPAAPGVDALRAFNVHTIAIQIPISRLTRNGQGADRPVGPRRRDRRVGVGVPAEGPLPRRAPQLVVRPVPQVSRLGNPLFNEVIVPMGRKDRWNAVPPHRDSDFAQYVARPELGKLLPVLYPGVFPNLATLTEVDRADLLAILLTGIPAGLIPGFQNFTGPTQADMLRLNVAIPPTAPSPNLNGILGGDLAGFPNGRRVFDNVVTIELQAIAGATYPLVDPTYVPDGAASLINDGVTPPGNVSYLDVFPYLDHPSVATTCSRCRPEESIVHTHADGTRHHDHDDHDATTAHDGPHRWFTAR